MTKCTKMKHGQCILYAYSEREKKERKREREGKKEQITQPINLYRVLFNPMRLFSLCAVFFSLCSFSFSFHKTNCTAIETMKFDIKPVWKLNGELSEQKFKKKPRNKTKWNEKKTAQIDTKIRQHNTHIEQAVVSILCCFICWSFTVLVYVYMYFPYRGLDQSLAQC